MKEATTFVHRTVAIAPTRSVERLLVTQTAHNGGAVVSI